MLTKEKVLEFQENWGDNIIGISSAFEKGREFISLAKDLISNLYAYTEEEVLFKPTLASDFQFRKTKESALSYFVGGNSDFEEDKGFAIKGWTKVRWENSSLFLIKIKINGIY